MKRALAFLALAAALAFGTAASGQPQGSLRERIEAVINGPDYRQAHWGILAADRDTGVVLYAHNADRMFTPLHQSCSP